MVTETIVLAEADTEIPSSRNFLLPGTGGAAKLLQAPVRVGNEVPVMAFTHDGATVIEASHRLPYMQIGGAY